MIKFTPKALLLSAIGTSVALGASVNQMFAFSGDANGFPMIEPSDVSIVKSGIGSAGSGVLNNMIASWQIFVALAVLTAVVGMLYFFRGRLFGAVK